MAAKFQELLGSWCEVTAGISGPEECVWGGRESKGSALGLSLAP